MKFRAHSNSFLTKTASRSLGLAVAIASAMAINSSAQTVSSWSGATGGDWNTGSNWTASAVPTLLDDLTILGPDMASALTINIASATDISANTINFTHPAAVLLLNPSTSNRSLTLQAGLTTGMGAVTIGSTTGGQNINVALGASQVWNVGSGGLTAINVISGTGFGITKSGAGTLTLSGVNTYSGGTTVSAGILQLTQLTGATATGTFSLGGGTLRINQAGNNFGYSSAIALTADSTFSNIGAGAINYTGTLTGNTHALNVNSGVSRLYINSTTSGITQFNVTSGAMGFDLNVGNRGGGAAVVVSNGASLFFANANTTLANNITLNGGVGLGGVGALFQEGTANATLSGILTLNRTSTIGGSGTGNVTLSGKVTGAGGLTKIGSNNYILTNSANDYSGSTTIVSGTLTLNGNTGVLPSNATINGGGGTFNYQGATAGSTLNASGYTLGGDLTIQSTYGTSGNTQVTLASATRTAGNTFNYAISGGTNGTTNKIVFNTAPTTGILLDKGLFFNGSNYATYDTGGFVRAYSYSTDANGFTSTGGTTFGATSSTSNVDLTTAAVTAQTTTQINTLRLGTTFGVAMAGGETLTVDGILKSGGNAATITGGTGIQASSDSELVVRTNASNDTLTISTPILANGASSLTKSGAGTAVLLSSNTYTGGTTVAGGTLQVGNSTTAAASGSTTSLGAAGSTVSVNGTLRFQMGTTSSNALDQNFVFNTGSTLNHNDGRLTFGSATAGVASNARTITVNGSTTWNPLFNTKQFIMAGVVQGSGDINIVRPALSAESGYVLFLNDTNTYSGTITTNGSIGSATTGNATGIMVGTTNTLQFANIVNNTLNSTASASGLIFQTTSATLGSLAGAGNFILGQNTAALTVAPNETTSSAAVALTVGGSNASTTYSGQMSGLGSLTKTGTGTMTLTGNSTYSGGTIITQGRLLANNTTGSATGSGNVSITGATLGGTGSISGGSTANITFGAGSFLAIGNTHAAGGLAETLEIGTGTGGSITSTAGTTFQFDLMGAGTAGSAPAAYNLNNDYLDFTTAASLNLLGFIQISAADTSSWLPGEQTWKLIDWSGMGDLGSSTNLLYFGTIGNYVLNSFTNSSGFYVTASLVPEPSRALLLMAGLGLLGLRRKR